MKKVVDVRDEPLSIDSAFSDVQDPGAGGICMFIGVVRDVDEQQRVSALSYEAHPTATGRMREIVDEVASRIAVTAISVVHRIGDLAVGDLAVVVAVSAQHRGESFEAGKEIIDMLKTEVPIWKLQTFATGDAEWVNTP